MTNQSTKNNLKLFEQIKKIDTKGNEFWDARELAKILEYSEYRHFLPVIHKAKESCENSKQKLSDHFEHIIEMAHLGNGAKRKIENIKLSRYACYLVVQNADPAKEIVALGQTYFAVQTRIQEISAQLASAAKEAGVINSLDYAIFQNHGYKGLYGGLDTKAIHKKKGLKKSQKILDHMGSAELAANLFRATQTEEKLRKEKITGRVKANKTHFEVGAKVRQTIRELGGTMPENLPSASSIKKIEAKNKPKNLK